jgi:hypothetical protein
MEFDGAFGVLVRDLEDLASDTDVDAKLLFDLAAQAAFVILAGLALAARELPEPFEVDAARAACHQVSIAAPDHGGGDDDPRQVGAHAERSLSGLKG